MIKTRSLFTAIIAVVLLVALVLVVILPSRAPDSVRINGDIEPTDSGLPTAGSQSKSEIKSSDLSTTQSPLSIEQSAEPIRPENLVAQQGWVGNASGAGLAEVEVRVESSGFDGEEITAHGATTNQRGEYRFQELVKGRQYKLEIKPSGHYAGFSLDAFTAGTTDALPEIVLKQIKLVDVDGMIVDANNAPLADFEFSVHSLSVEFPDQLIRSDSSGFFNLSAFPAGELRIATNSADYYRIKGVELLPDEYRNLTLVIDRGNYYLSGWVSDDNGAPLADVQVTIKSAFAVDGYHSFSYRSTVTDGNGAFEFAQLGGHRLTLGIYASNFKTLIRQHEFKSFSDNLEITLQK